MIYEGAHYSEDFYCKSLNGPQLNDLVSERDSVTLNVINCQYYINSVCDWLKAIFLKLQIENIN